MENLQMPPTQPPNSTAASSTPSAKFVWTCYGVPIGEVTPELARLCETMKQDERDRLARVIWGVVETEKISETPAVATFRCWVKRNRHLLAFWFGVAEVVLIGVLVVLEWVRR